MLYSTNNERRTQKGGMFILLLVVGILIALAIGASWHRTGYWKRRGVPGPESSLFNGNLTSLGNPIDNPHPLMYPRWTKLYGPYFGIQRGWKNALVISDPQMANEVMHSQFQNFHGRDHAPVFGDEDYESMINVFVSRGKRWKRLRALTSSAFSTLNLRKIFPTINECGTKFVENIQEDLEKNGNILDIEVNFHEYTADVLLRLGFGRKETRDEIQKFTPMVFKLLKLRKNWSHYISWVAPFTSKPLKFVNYAELIIGNFGIFKFIKQLFGDLKKKKAERDKNEEREERFTSFMDFFMDAESDDIQLEDNTTYSKKNATIVKSLTLEEVVGQCLMFMFAGFDTTAGTLSFISYYLAMFPEVQEKLRDEIEQFIGLESDPTYESLLNLKYADAVLKETLRLNPIGGVVTSRKCAQSTKLGNLEIEPDTHILLDVISIHRNRDLWGDNAGEFLPERWLQEDSHKLAANFYGFGVGPRQCVGMKLAFIEEKIALVKLLQRYRLQETSRTNEATQITGYVMVPKRTIVKLERI